MSPSDRGKTAMKKVSDRDFTKDVRAGMGDMLLMEKYNLKPSEFRQIVRDLVEKGFLTEEDLDKTRDPMAPAAKRDTVCPSCGATFPGPVDECLKCGIVMSKYEETVTLQPLAAYRPKTPHEEAMAKAFDEVKRLDVKEREIRERAGLEGLPSIFVGIALVAAGIVVGYLEVPGVAGAVLPVVLGGFIYFQGCYVVAAGKGYTGREGLFLGFLFGIGTLVLLLMPNRHTGVWGYREALVFALFIPAVILLVAIGIARLTGEFIL
jgi:hypothetical protein